MRRSLPSLRALRAFEATGRNLSCTRAAEELAVSQSAVSHQVRLLEEGLGVQLFRRESRKMILTGPGRDLLEVTRSCFDRLEEIAIELNARKSRQIVNISLSYPIGVAWLSRHIGVFGRLHPNVEVNLNYSWSLVDLEKEEIDFAIRWGRGNWPAVEAEPLLPGHMVPMCAPDYLPSDDPLELQTGVLRDSLLHVESYHKWAEWLQGAGLDTTWAQRGALLGDAMNLIRAAVDGDGVILMWLPLAVNELERGTLMIPSSLGVDEDCSYWLVRSPRYEPSAMAKELYDYLLRVAAEDRSFLDNV